MKFSVGLQYQRKSFLDCIEQYAPHIGEIYFAWGDFPNGRNSQLFGEEDTPWERQHRQIEALEMVSHLGIPLNLLFNATCYGEDSQSRTFFHKVGQAIDYIGSRFGLESITTTSPLIAKFTKDNFPQLKTRASVNMEIGTVQGMDYLGTYFDGYYMQRECNRDFEKIKTLSTWCSQNRKTLHILANSGCLNHCSAHIFHDNLVSHEQQIVRMDNAYQFTGICREYLRDPVHYESLIKDTSFIRPEDVVKYEPYFQTMKLATRVHRCPEQVLQSYINRRYSGDILALLEPAHSIYPYVIENGEPLRLVKIGE